MITQQALRADVKDRAPKERRYRQLNLQKLLPAEVYSTNEDFNSSPRPIFKIWQPQDVEKHENKNS